MQTTNVTRGLIYNEGVVTKLSELGHKWKGLAGLTKTLTHICLHPKMPYACGLLICLDLVMGSGKRAGKGFVYGGLWCTGRSLGEVVPCH